MNENSKNIRLVYVPFTVLSMALKIEKLMRLKNVTFNFE